jgi:hypothetical protein
MRTLQGKGRQSTPVSERAIAIAEAARALSLAALGYTIETVTIDPADGGLSETRLSTPPSPEHKAFALLAMRNAVVLLCASQATGPLLHPMDDGARSLLNDPATLAAWTRQAETFVIARQIDITNIAIALLRCGTISGDEAVEAAAYRPPAPSPLKSVEDDYWEVWHWQDRQARVMRRVAAVGFAHG